MELFHIKIFCVNAKAFQHIFRTVIKNKLCFMAAQVGIFILGLFVAHMIDMVGSVLFRIL